MIFEVVPKGRSVTVRRGPATTRHRFGSEEEALDFAEQVETEWLAEQEARLDLLARYSDPSHPAAPVAPAAFDLDQVRDDLEALRAVDPAPVVETAETPTGPRVSVRMSRAAADQVAVTFRSDHPTDVELERWVETPGSKRPSRAALVTIEAGRELTRRYKLYPGERILFAWEGVVLAWFLMVEPGETNTGPVPGG